MFLPPISEMNPESQKFFLEKGSFFSKVFSRIGMSFIAMFLLMGALASIPWLLAGEIISQQQFEMYLPYGIFAVLSLVFISAVFSASH